MDKLEKNLIANQKDGKITFIDTSKNGSGLHNDAGHLVMKDKDSKLRLLLVQYDEHTIVVLGATRAHLSDDTKTHKFYESQEQAWENYITDEKGKKRKLDVKELEKLEEDYKYFRSRLYFSNKSNMDNATKEFIERISQKSNKKSEEESFIWK